MSSTSSPRFFEKGIGNDHNKNRNVFPSSLDNSKYIYTVMSSTTPMTCPRLEEAAATIHNRYQGPNIPRNAYDADATTQPDLAAIIHKASEVLAPPGPQVRILPKDYFDTRWNQLGHSRIGLYNPRKNSIDIRENTTMRALSVGFHEVGEWYAFTQLQQEMPESHRIATEIAIMFTEAAERHPGYDGALRQAQQYIINRDPLFAEIVTEHINAFMKHAGLPEHRNIRR